MNIIFFTRKKKTETILKVNNVSIDKVFSGPSTDQKLCLLLSNRGTEVKKKLELRRRDNKLGRPSWLAASTRCPETGSTKKVFRTSEVVIN